MYLVEQSAVGELPDQLATADDPKVLAACRLNHLLMHGLDIVADEGEIGIRDRGARRCFCDGPSGQHGGHN
ncbi:MAG: hypothetical protein M3445_09330 [Actinomycetota bacterium]|nr:hypothetical protein [Actinomycetota bacterium]